MLLSQKQDRGRDVLTFRHFSRKGYALFACLGREVRVGVLSTATLMSAAACLHAGAQNPSTSEKGKTPEQSADTTLLEEAVVSASRVPMAAGLAARQVTTLSREDLAAAGVTSVNDLLKKVVGVDVRQRGGFGMQTDISIDGGTFDQITLLVNGVAINNPQTGHNAADFPLNLSDIERVEILEGAASRVFGSQAFSGAINIVTRDATRHAGAATPSTRHELSASVEAGSYGTLLGEARYAWNSPARSDAGRWYLSASGSGRRSDGAVDNGDFRGGKFYGAATYDHPEFRVEAQAGATINDFGANTFYSAAYPNQWEATSRYLISVRGESKGRLHLSPSVSWLRSVDHFQLIRDTPTGENFHRGDVFTAGLNGWVSWWGGRTALGAEVCEEAIYSTNLGRPLDESQYVDIPRQDGLSYTKHDDRTNVSYFLEHNIVWRQWTLSAGVMAERNSAIDHRFRFYPGVDLSFRPGTNWRLYASWNRSLRLPSFTDLYYKSPTQEGNVGLRPEECSTWRIGMDYRRSFASVQVKAYYNRGTNMIDWVMRTADDIYHAANFQLDNYGASLTAELLLNRLWGERQPFRRLQVGYAYIYQHRRDNEPYFKSNYAMEYLRHKFTASLSHRIWDRLGATWSLRVQDRAGAYLVYENYKATGELRPYGAHALLDCRLEWTGRHYKVYADLCNLTSHRYYDLANVRQAGFTCMGGIAIDLWGN